MNWLDQNAIWLVLACVVAAAILAGGWLQTGRRVLVLAAALPILLALALLIVQQLVVTDREQVEATLHEIAGHVRRNDLDAVLRHVDPQSPRVADQARSEFPRYEFDEVTIKRNLEVTVDRRQQPPKAVAEFNVTVLVSEKAGAFQKQRVPRFAVVTFLLRDGKWRVSDYRHFPPTQGMLRRDDGGP